jgi:hypothetical protein
MGLQKKIAAYGRYLETAVVQLLVARSLPSNGSTRYNRYEASLSSGWEQQNIPYLQVQGSRLTQHCFE